MSRLEDLRALRDGLLGRLEKCESDQNYAVLARTLTDVLAQIDQLDPQMVREVTPLDEFTKRLVARRRADSQAVDKTASN